MHQLTTKNGVIRGHIPLVSVEETAQGLPFIHNLCLSTNCATIEVERWHAGLFALIIEDSSLCPRFYPGYIAVVDSTYIPRHGDYVLVFFPEQQKTLLRRLMFVNGKQFLLAHNVDCPAINLSLKKPEEYLIQGVVVNTIMKQSLKEINNEINSSNADEFMPSLAKLI